MKTWTVERTFNFSLGSNIIQIYIRFKYGSNTCSNYDVFVMTRARVFCMRCILFKFACEMPVWSDLQ